MIENERSKILDVSNIIIRYILFVEIFKIYFVNFNII